MFLRKYATLTVTGTTAIRIPIIKRGVVDFAVGADWTPAAGDVRISVDGAAATNVTNLPVANTSGNTAYWEFILTAAELTGKQIVVTVADAATKAVEDQCFIVETFGHASAMYPVDLSASVLPVNVTHFGGNAGTFDAGKPTVELDPASVTAVQSGLATASALATTHALLQLTDTDVAAIEARLPSDPADQSAVEAAITAATSPLATPSQVNAQVLDVLSVDTFAELTAPPAATSSLKDKITWLFMYARNKVTQTALARTLYRDDTTTVAGTSATSDNGTTFTKGEDT
jgi:hypothetical protein